MIRLKELTTDNACQLLAIAWHEAAGLDEEHPVINGEDCYGGCLEVVRGLYATMVQWDLRVVTREQILDDPRPMQRFVIDRLAGIPLGAPVYFEAPEGASNAELEKGAVDALTARMRS